MAAQEGSMAKRLHSGLACQSGVRSALLAAAGFTGIPNVLEADFGGFCSTMGGGQVDLGRAHLGPRLAVGDRRDRLQAVRVVRCGAVEHRGRTPDS